MTKETMNSKDYIEFLEKRIEAQKKFVDELDQTYDKADIYFAGGRIVNHEVLKIKSNILQLMKSCENYTKTMELILKEFKK